MTPFFYQFGIGAIFFTVGIYFAARQDYIGFHGKGLRNLIFISIPFLFYFTLQGFLQFGDLHSVDPTPFNGESGRARTLGAPVDYGIMVFYFLAILMIGTYFGRKQKTVKDFFFGGQRFPWWLITFSLIATTVGSYSFVKYSRVAYTYGFGSSQ
ncbi:MAG: hypothetical protein DWQ10_12610, partial [Calditrichaeota bacterium]